MKFRVRQRSYTVKNNKIIEPSNLLKFSKGSLLWGWMQIRTQTLQMQRKASRNTLQCRGYETRRCPIFLPNRLGAPWQITPIEVDRLDHMLNGYPFHLRSYLIESFNFGFQEHFEGERGIFERSQFNKCHRAAGYGQR